MAVLKNTLVWLSLVTAIALIGCEKSVTTQIDPKLIGNWTDKNVRYYFNSNLNYGLKYLRKGSGVDTVVTDSAFGNYTLDVSNNTISFVITGYKLKTGTTVGANINAGVWNYSISGYDPVKRKDTVLTYTTLTSNGRLVRF
ncbi:MAG: hypothetical protein K2Q22_15900 [Cytophagales bacterium]|nr:hypothetical protein [Cytophagales bacterium]